MDVAEDRAGLDERSLLGLLTGARAASNASDMRGTPRLPRCCTRRRDSAARRAWRLRRRCIAHSLKSVRSSRSPRRRIAARRAALPLPAPGQRGARTADVITAVHTLAHRAKQIEWPRCRQLSGIRTSWQWHGNCSSHLQPMKNIDPKQLETTTGGCAPVPPCCPPPCVPACMPPAPAPAAAWRWAARAQYRAAAYYGYGGYGWAAPAPAARRWWW